MLNLLLDLGAFQESIQQLMGSNATTCPGGIDPYLHLLKHMAEMAFYSRASDIDPPFLPGASEEDVYRMLNVADYIRSTENLDNIDSAKKGLIFAKSLLSALSLEDDSERQTTQHAESSGETMTITIYVGHDYNINNIATALGLRWTVPSPYVYGSEDQIGKIITIPPGSGILFSSKPGDDDNNAVSMSFIIPTNLIDNNINETSHDMLPIYTIDMAQPELAMRDDNAMMGNGRVSVQELKRRLESTMAQYPDLRPCYENAPIVLGNNQPKEVKNALGTTTAAALLVVMLVVNVFGCVLLIATQVCGIRFWRSNKYKRVRLEKRVEVELS